jgi:hypothetical protein
MAQFDLEDPLLVALPAVPGPVQDPREGRFDPCHPINVEVRATQQRLVLDGPICDGVAEGLINEDPFVVIFRSDFLRR